MAFNRWVGCAKPVVVRADERFGTIPRMALASAERFGDSLAVVDSGRCLSFADVAEGMLAVGRALIASGVEPGDRVALWAPNSSEWMMAALGIQAAGAWLVPLNTRFRGEEAAFIVDRAEVRLLLVVEQFLGVDYLTMLREVAPHLKASQDAVTLPGPDSGCEGTWREFLGRADGSSVDRLLGRMDALDGEDVSDVIFTSGTTGTPKGVMLRHGASLRAFEVYNRGTRLGPGDRHAVVVPFFHCFGYKAGWMLNLMVGAVTYPLAVFNPDSMMRLIEAEGITHLAGPPTLFGSILDHPSRDRFDLSSLRSVLVSAAAVPSGLITRLRDEVGVDGAISGYGLTENHALVSVADPDDPDEIITSTVGRPIPDIDVRIVDDEGNAVGPGQPGELHVRGYTVMSGYFREPEATADTVVDGWLHTGDIAALDELGYLRITDRKKDIFVMGGFNVSPVEVERALMGLDKLDEVAVIGVSDPEYGEVGAAFVIAKPGMDLTAEEVIAFAREHLANFKVPRRVVIVDALPRNATGKVLKPQLRRRLSD